MKARRALFVADSLEVGGAERVLVGLAAGLSARGTRVTIAASIGGALESDARSAGVDVRILGSSLVKRRADHLFTAGINHAVEEEMPDVVHSHMFASTVAAADALQYSDVPLVVHEHSEAGWRDKNARSIAARAYRRSTAVIAVSNSIRERLLYVDRVSPGKIVVLRNTLPPLPACALAGPVSTSDGPVVGVVARLQPEKGVDVFLRAAAQVRRAVPGVSFVVAGDGSRRHELERMAARLAVPVTFLGFRPDGPALVGVLDLLVVPSFSEGTPLVVLEAASAGVPIVATAVGGILEQLEAEREALLVRPGDDIELATACRRVLVNPALAARLANAARQRVAHDSRPGRALDAVEGVYDRATNVIPVRRAQHDGRGAA